MTTQAQVTKSNMYVALSPPAGNVMVPKAVMYVLLVPDGSGTTSSTSQGHTYSQITKRLRS